MPGALLRMPAAAYGLGAEQIQQMRERFAEWRLELLRQPGPAVA